MLIQANQIIKEVVDAHRLCTLCCVNTCLPNLLHSVGVMEARISRLSTFSITCMQTPGFKQCRIRETYSVVPAQSTLMLSLYLAQRISVNSGLEWEMGVKVLKWRNTQI